MLYFIQLQYIMRRLSGDTQAVTEKCVVLPVSSSLICHNRGGSCLLRDFGVCGWDDQLQLHLLLTLAGGDGGENRVGDVRLCLITCLQMVSGLCQCKDYRVKEQFTLLSPPDRVDFWVGLIGTADKRIPIQIYTKYIALQYRHQCDIFPVLIE